MVAGQVFALLSTTPTQTFTAGNGGSGGSGGADGEAVEATLDLTTVLMVEVPMAVAAAVPMVATFAIMSKGTPTRVKFAEVAKYP